jgi:Cu/Ag efflux pump CusA
MVERVTRMNAIVVVALKRPYTFVVLAILILLFGTMAVFKTPTDIFPPIKIPVVAVIWNYNGLMPSDMSGRVVYYYERALTTTVGNIEHIESQSLYGSVLSLRTGRKDKFSVIARYLTRSVPVSIIARTPHRWRA